MRLSTIVDKSPESKYLILLAHGAGAGMQHTFMHSVAYGLAKQNATVVRFNFSYMDEGKKFPTSQKKSLADINDMIKYVQAEWPELPVFLGGKSYGGRMHSHWIAQHPGSGLCGVMYLGFPLHAPGKDSTARAEHLTDVDTPQLFLQGTNDKLANFQLIQDVCNKLHNAQLVAFEEADHSFKVPKRTGKSNEDIIKELTDTINKWALDQL